jgi:hypothetical protein
MRIRLAILSTLLMTGLCMSSMPAAAADASPTVMLDDFVHYALTAQVEMARSNGEALLNSELSDKDLAELVDEDPRMRDRLPVAIRWAREVPSLADIASAMESRVEKGRMDMARDIDRINEAIQMLGGTRRARSLAHARLVEAGEFAVPPMLVAMSDPGTSTEIQLGLNNTLPTLGREAVLPLSAALPNVPASQQVLIINTLADIGYPHAGATLIAVGKNPKATDVVASAAARAIQRLGWEDPNVDLASLHVQLAEDYLREMEHLRARPALVQDADGNLVPMQTVWGWDTHGGLVSQLVPTDLYWPTMAVRHAAKAREIDPNNGPALVTFVAGNLRLENRVGERDVVLPVPQLDRSPSFHATVHGPAVAREVLLMAIDQDDNDMARDALAALARTGGAASLLGGGEREAITEALAHADQRVRYDAALVVSRAMPDQSFAGSNRVVPLLGAAVQGGAGRQSVVVGGTPAEQKRGEGRLEAAGYQVAGTGQTWADLTTSTRAGGIDLAVVYATNAQHSTWAQLADAGVPIVLVVPSDDLATTRQMSGGMPGIGVLKNGASDAAFTSVLASLGLGTPLDDADRRFYASESLSALRDLAMSRPAGLDAAEATPQLEQALMSDAGPQQLMVAEVLAVINDSSAQQAIVNAALKATDEWQQTSLLDLAAASARRYGDHLSSRQVADLRDFIGSARGEVADAAARLYGALDRGDVVSVDTAVVGS